MKKYALALIFLFLCFPCLADTIILKSGKTVEGKIVERTDTSIKVDIGGVALTYWMDQIQTINDKTFSGEETKRIYIRAVSVPCLSMIVKGSTTLPLLFDITFPPSVTIP